MAYPVKGHAGVYMAPARIAWPTRQIVGMEERFIAKLECGHEMPSGYTPWPAWQQSTQCSCCCGRIDDVRQESFLSAYEITEWSFSVGEIVHGRDCPGKCR